MVAGRKNVLSLFDTIILITLLFCYVFAFYLGPISISILMCIPLYLYSLFCVSFRKKIFFVLGTPLILMVCKIWFVLILLSLFYPLLFQTFDFTFFRLVGAQGLHYVAAFPFFAFLSYKNVSYDSIEKWYVKIFLIQTIIQLIVVNSPYLSEAILSFNRYDPESVVGLGSSIRGKGLSAATTYHLTMVYGICFIIFTKRYLINKVSLINVIRGILIFVGIFFAGRTGFVGVLLGMLGFLFYKKISFKNKFLMLLKLLLIVSFLVLLISQVIYVMFPAFWETLNSQILPYAFEFIYSLDNNEKMETASTNHLMSMWTDSKFDYIEFLIGSGHYTNPDSSYYMHVDPGILRHLLFMGVFGYFFIVLYQFMLFPVWKMKGDTRYFYSLILLFLCIMEFKGINLGLNKFAFAITLLFSYSYFYLRRDS